MVAAFQPGSSAGDGRKPVSMLRQSCACRVLGLQPPLLCSSALLVGLRKVSISAQRCLLQGSSTIENATIKRIREERRNPAKGGGKDPPL